MKVHAHATRARMSGARRPPDALRAQKRKSERKVEVVDLTVCDEKACAPTKWLGLDPGTKNHGWAVLQAAEAGTPVVLAWGVEDIHRESFRATVERGLGFVKGLIAARKT